MQTSLTRIATMVRIKCEAAYYDKVVDHEGVMNAKLCGMCAIASFALWKSFQSFGVKECRVREGTCVDIDHCWVQVGVQIYDITATQFDISNRVYITSVFDIDYLANNVSRKNYHQFKDWPKSQLPTPELTRILKVEPCEII